MGHWNGDNEGLFLLKITQIVPFMMKSYHNRNKDLKVYTEQVSNGMIKY